MSQRTTPRDKEELEFLYEIDELCDRTEGLDDLVRVVLNELSTRLGLQGAACVLREPATGELMLRGVVGDTGGRPRASPAHPSFPIARRSRSGRYPRDAAPP